ncbi:MAG: putative Phosphoribosylglycinamide formyltransferase [Pseudomonadota bacterium]|jgi:phosphoribosylglycinamide formyltransferase-1
MARLAVLVSGSGSNLQAILNAVEARTIAAEVAVVISNKPGVRALERAVKAGVPALCLSHQNYPSREAFDAALVTELKARNVDWVVLAGFMRLLTKVFLDEFRDRVLNLHPSLLPAFPGVNSARQALDHGVKVTGCTVHLVTEGMDAGPIIAQQAVPVLDDDTEESLLERLHQAEHELLVSVVAAVCDGGLTVERPMDQVSARAKVRLNER